MQSKSNLLYQGCVSTLIYRAIALLFLGCVLPHWSQYGITQLGKNLFGGGLYVADSTI